MRRKTWRRQCATRQGQPAAFETDLYGISMGAAAILRAVHSCGVQPDAIIVEAVFDRMLATVGHRFEVMGLPSFPGLKCLFYGADGSLGSTALATIRSNMPQASVARFCFCMAPLIPWRLRPGRARFMTPCRGGNGPRIYRRRPRRLRGSLPPAMEENCKPVSERRAGGSRDARVRKPQVNCRRTFVIHFV